MSTKEVDAQDFEAEFKLEGNEAQDPGEEQAADAAAIEARTDELLELEGIEDNVKIDEIKEAQAKRREEAAAAKAAEEAGDAEEDEAGDETEEEVGEGEDEEAEEEGEGEADEDEEAPAADLSALVTDLPAEKAQELFDSLAARDDVVIRYRADGEEHEDTLAGLKQKAAGYVGQHKGVQKMIREANEKVGEAERVRQEAERQVANVRAVLAKIDDPDAFVDDVVLPTGTREYMEKLNERLTEYLEMEPSEFRREQRMARLERQGMNGAAPPAPPAASDEGTQDGKQDGIPPDFGFMPGKGYPHAYVDVAFASLQAASKATGIDVSKVLDAWDEGGKQEDPFTVLNGLVRQRYAEASKVDRMRKPPRKPKGKTGGVRSPKPNPNARRTRHVSPEQELADELRALAAKGEL